jgi:hypothetical protein
MNARLELLHTYLSALEGAAHAIEQARRIRPDPGLDHAIDRLRFMLFEGARELASLDDESGCECGGRH